MRVYLVGCMDIAGYGIRAYSQDIIYFTQAKIVIVL